MTRRDLFRLLIAAPFVRVVSSAPHILTPEDVQIAPTLHRPDVGDEVVITDNEGRILYSGWIGGAA